MPTGSLANPSGMTVVTGTATTQTSGSQLHVTVGQTTFLNWNTFNIQQGETTTFIQPALNSVVINNIGDTKPSQIWGNLSANGTVILANANGFYFGPNSMIKVGGSFIATTVPLLPDMGADGMWQFTGPPPLASIVNYGQIQVGNGQSLYLIAEQVNNFGALSAPAGDLGLYAGQEVLLNERADGRGFSAAVKLPAGSVDNEGKLVADAGTIALQAQVVNQNGIIQADSVLNQNGVVELIAGDSLNLGANSAISTKGDTQGISPGGFVIAKSGNSFSDTPTSAITVSGGTSGGRDGVVEVFGSGMTATSIQSSIDQLSAAQFAAHDILLINPYDITLSTSATSTSVSSGSSPNFNVSDLSSYSHIALVANDNIELQSAWTLNDPGVPDALALQAGNNIIFDRSADLVANNNWSVSLDAGPQNLASAPNLSSSPASGSDGIFLTGASFLATQNGDLNLRAGGDVEVGTGYINTKTGGNIFAQSSYGDVNAGANNTGYQVTTSGLIIGGSRVGGISTYGGGNVTMEAGNNVISVPAPTLKTSAFTPGASGAYNGGDVTVVAGNQIIGNFLVSSGTGLLEAGVAVQKDPVTGIYNATINPSQTTADIGNPMNPVTLSLISGNWYAYAAQDIYVTEVNNPNGTFNSSRLPVPSGVFSGNEDGSGNIAPAPAASSFLFNYAPDSGATFWAGNSITLGVGNLVRLNGQLTTPPNIAIYPPSLSLEAGVGGITFDTSIILYPSAEGTLNLVTHDGGDLNGVYVTGKGINTGLTMSDSGLPGWSTFASGQAVTPVHLPEANDPNNQVNLNISGGINSFVLAVPTAATIVASSADNFGLTAQNLTSSAITSINIAGDISYRGDVTSITLSDYNAAPLPAALFDNSLSANVAVTENLFYNATTGQLSFLGQVSSADLTFLLNPSEIVTGTDGQPLTTPVGLSPQQKAAIQALGAASQTAQTDATGISVNGPGRLTITAQNMDLGISSGIQVNKALVPQLTAISLQGASLDVTLGGNLEMTSTRILNSGWRGGIQLTVDGTIDVGQQSGILGAPNASRGIYTSGGGNLSVTATTGDINVDGSRIAAYDGGNLTVVSTQGDVNAGSGGNGAVFIDSVVELGSDGKLENLANLPLYGGSIPIYGSGLMATTPRGSSVNVGNITVQAPQGNINANIGGIEQIAFNNLTAPGNFIELDAGKDISAGNSGVIGSNIRASAENISGIFVGSGGIDINAVNNFAGTIVGSTSVSVNAGGTVSGTIVGGESVSVSGGDISASLVSGSVSTAGDASSAAVGVPKSNVSQEDAKVAEDASATAVGNSDRDDNDQYLKRRAGQKPQLARLTGRVTVILPETK